MKLRLFLPLISTFLVLITFSCTQGPPQLMPKETLFSLEQGTLEDQVDVFLRNKVPSPEKNRFFYYNGILVLANGNARKIMELTSYGDLVNLFYNSDTNPQPLLLHNSGTDAQVKNRQAFPYAFNHVGELSIDSQDRLLVEDKVTPERRVWDEKLQTHLDSVVLRFGKDGKFLDFLGQEGIGGTPFPTIDTLFVNSRDDVVVISHVDLGWKIWWYDSKGLLIASPMILNSKLPVPKGAEKSITNLETLKVDYNDRIIWTKINYFRVIQDSTSKTDAAVQNVQNRMWFYDLGSGQFSDAFTLPVLARTKGKNDKEDPKGDRPYDFLGVSQNKLFFFLSSPERGEQRFMVSDRHGKVVLERTVEFEQGENSWMADYQITPKGVMVALLSDGKKIEFSWWRSDKLLNTYGPSAF